MGKCSALGATLACALITLGTGAPAGAADLFMGIGKPTSQPIGHFNYCRTSRDDCRPRKAGAPAPAEVDGLTLLGVAAINRAVNAEIRPASDEDAYGVEELWTLPKHGEGDCEDYALLKRQRLEAAGIDVGNLLLTVVKKPDGEGHAVLTLHTTQGDFVLDNLDQRVKLWTDTPYTFVKRQSASNAGRWNAIVDGDAPALVAATRR